MRKENLISPGEILEQEFLVPMNISQGNLAAEINVPVALIDDIIHGKGSITTNIAEKLGAFFKTGSEFWLNIHANYEAGIMYNGFDYTKWREDKFDDLSLSEISKCASDFVKDHPLEGKKII